MEFTEKLCHYCGQPYRADPRTKRVQTICAKITCRRKRKRQNYLAWLERNPGYQASRRVKTRIWAKAYPDYWRKYRGNHPDYVLRDNRRRIGSYRKAKRSAKQITRHHEAIEKLRGIALQVPGSKVSAKQTAIHRRVNGILEYLFWKESSAKQTAIALPTVPM